ncbi:hypothetical protein BJEO58_02071 [Brevibacterium jeotgali]|uniref:Uncharacterized protein n=2 Tax=Brevibacterium jeotgali TaxID=1262550 RepID=A0A2H1L6S4_9MICO|nr:hypothetical protein FB108_2929 [Brevibacterium jeotgali]SMY12475.1 hypothetical protein BJEO58_02071 [Brevibacterium jeotgali]
MTRRCVECVCRAALGAQWAAMSSAPALPPLASRHPVVIGALEALRAVLVLVLTVLLVALAAWFVAIAQLQPLSSVVGWAGTVLGAASGWELTIGLGLPPTLLTVGLMGVMTSALRRTRRALAANEQLVRAGVLPATRYAATVGIVTCLGAIVLVLLLAGLLVGAGTLTPLGFARFLVVVSVPVLIACLGPERRGAPAGRWAQALFDLVATKAGGEWADALESALRVLRRVGLAFATMAVLVLIIALATGWSAMSTAVAGYSRPAFAAGGLAFVQLLFLPTLLLITVSWLSGAGLHLSAAALATPFSSQAAVVPAVPVLAAVPTDTAAWGWSVLVILPLAAGVATVGRRTWAEEADWRVVVITVGLGFVCTAAAVLFASGPIGPAGLETFGVPLATAIATIGGAAGAGAAGGWGLSLLANREAADQ